MSDDNTQGGSEPSPASAGSTPDFVDALNPSDPSGPPLKVRFPKIIASIVCPDCREVVGGGDPAYLCVSQATKYRCPFCGKGPPVIESQKTAGGE
jgi:hypothetical protein